MRNDKAVAGYQHGTFPDGAIVVDEAVFTKEGEGTATGLLLEGERRFLDVMVKDAGALQGKADGATSTSIKTTRPAGSRMPSGGRAPPVTRRRRRITSSAASDLDAVSSTPVPASARTSQAVNQS